MTAGRRQANQAAHWNAKQQAASTPQERAAVWWDACRMVAHQHERSGNPQVWRELIDHLHRFYEARAK